MTRRPVLHVARRFPYGWTVRVVEHVGHRVVARWHGEVETMAELHTALEAAARIRRIILEGGNR